MVLDRTAQWLSYAREHDPELLKQFKEQAVKETEKRFAQARPRFLKTHGKSIRGSWCGSDLGARAIQTHMEVPYRLINPYGSQLVHGTAGSMLNHFDMKKDLSHMSHPPSLKWCAQSICGGHLCLAMTIHTLENLFEEEAVPNSDAVAADFQYAWPGRL